VVCCAQDSATIDDTASSSPAMQCEIILEGIMNLVSYV
jgi:hypothetical protein